MVRGKTADLYYHACKSAQTMGARKWQNKFYLPTTILEAKNYRQSKRDGKANPFLKIASLSVPISLRQNMRYPCFHAWDLAVIDESHRLRNVYKTDNKIAKAIKTALPIRQRFFSQLPRCKTRSWSCTGLVSVIDDYAFGDLKSFKTQVCPVLPTMLPLMSLNPGLRPYVIEPCGGKFSNISAIQIRISLTEDFFPTDDEIALYDMVTEYLREEPLYALPNSQRQLITLFSVNYSHLQPLLLPVLWTHWQKG